MGNGDDFGNVVHATLKSMAVVRLREFPFERLADLLTPHNDMGHPSIA